jgi:hypothetical protein
MGDDETQDEITDAAEDGDPTARTMLQNAARMRHQRTDRTGMMKKARARINNAEFGLATLLGEKPWRGFAFRLDVVGLMSSSGSTDHLLSGPGRCDIRGAA